MPKKTTRPHRAPRMDELTTEDMERISWGLRLYSRNARAAAGTLKGLGRDSEAQQLEEEVEEIGQRLLPKFTEVAHA